MLTHRLNRPQNPVRTVILGAGGFVGAAAANALENHGASVLRVGRDSVDLCAPDAARNLASMLKPEDTLVFVSAIAPCKDPAQLLNNIRMAAAVCAAISLRPVAHLVYVSSDAVYSDGPTPLTESSSTAPTSLHGVMHLAREIMLASSVGNTPFAVLRPTLIYGAGDTHNGYGPNLFRRVAASSKTIVLFGEGEERRDHVLIDDVAEIIRLTVLHRSAGTLNIATGQVATFREIAEVVATQFSPAVKVEMRPRTGPMPHNGYRPFDITTCKTAFPSFQYTSLTTGLASVRKKVEANPYA